VVGWDRELTYDRLRCAALLLQRGARLVATNADPTYPAPDGLWPGAGSILAAVVTASGATPTVVGKPSRPMFEAAVESSGSRRPLVVGDRLDTDVGGAEAMGWDSLLVWSGAAQPPDLLAARACPTYVGPDLSVVLDDRPPARFRLATAHDERPLRMLLEACGLATSGVEQRLGGTLVSKGSDSGEGIDAVASLEEVGGVGLLRSVAVRPGLRGKGLGMLATAAAALHARSLGISRVFLMTETAEAFFKGLGFSTLSRDHMPDGIRAHHHVTEECPSAVAMVVDLKPLPTQDIQPGRLPPYGS
jgi:N-acetylglutamate synthase-like GNAT family acetyltransferase